MKVNVWGEDGQILVASGHHHPEQFARASALAFAQFHGKEAARDWLNELGGLQGVAQEVQCVHGSTDQLSDVPWVEWHRQPTSASTPYTLIDIEGGRVERDFIEPCTIGMPQQKCLRGAGHWGRHVGPGGETW